MESYYKPAKMNKGEFVRHMADKIESAIGITGTQFSYNMLSTPVTPEDIAFRNSINDIALVMKDRGYKVFGFPPNGDGIYKFYFSL